LAPVMEKMSAALTQPAKSIGEEICIVGVIVTKSCREPLWQDLR
jgi:hypothetical protein